MKKPDNKAKKTESKLTKIAVDATFGVKNKNKSKTVQNLVKNMAASTKGGYSKLQEEIYKEKKNKEKLEEEHKLMTDVFAKVVPKPVISVWLLFSGAGVLSARVRPLLQAHVACRSSTASSWGVAWESP